jgi:hypothetical protein
MNQNQSKTNLLVLDATTAGTLGRLNALLVRLDLAARHGAHHATSRLPWSRQLAGCGLTQEVDLDEVALERALEGDDGLDQKRVGVLEVDVHDGHHADTHQLRLVQLAELLEIVGLDRGRDELGLFAGTHRGGLDVLDNSHVWGIVSMLLLMPFARPEMS